MQLNWRCWFGIVQSCSSTKSCRILKYANEYNDYYCFFASDHVSLLFESACSLPSPSCYWKVVDSWYAKPPQGPRLSCSEFRFRLQLGDNFSTNFKSHKIHIPEHHLTIPLHSVIQYGRPKLLKDAQLAIDSPA